ncbi:MAG: metallophosphoesterase [Candidatus Moranbacteria bacterium]|nr:metallophosphoesterase [Candidatus Moranbacteria bacterium]
MRRVSLFEKNKIMGKTEKETEGEKKEEVKEEKRKINSIIGVVVLALVLVFGSKFAFESYQKGQQDTLKFGFVTDAHSYSKSIKNKEKEILGYEVNWRASEPMTAFVERMNKKFNPDFVIENGDFIKSSERAKEEFLELEEIFSQVDSPEYHVLGNHELRDMRKQDWLDLVGYEKPYYYFDVKNYRMIVLDGNAIPAGTFIGEKEDDISEGGFSDQSAIQERDEDINPSLEYYPGYVMNEQMEWLKGVLQESSDKKILVFVHQPPIPFSEVKGAGNFIFNKEELRSVFEKYGVVAVFSGHIEELCHQEINGVKYFVIPGFYKENQLVEEENQQFSVFSEIILKGRDIDVKMFYKKNEDAREEEHESMILDQSKSYCGKKVFE